jgi:hypothetical protein
MLEAGYVMNVKKFLGVRGRVRPHPRLGLNPQAQSPTPLQGL